MFNGAYQRFEQHYYAAAWWVIADCRLVLMKGVARGSPRTRGPSDWNVASHY